MADAPEMNATIEATEGVPAPAPALETPPVPPQPPPQENPPAPLASPAELSQQVGAIAQTLGQLQEMMLKADERMRGLEEQISYIPRQVQLLGNRVNGLATSVNEPRSRALLLDMLRIHDLIAQLLACEKAEPQTASASQRACEMLLTQVRQVLTVNGLVEIPADGAFNPELHRAMGRVPSEDPTKANAIASLLRPGFRTEQGTVLRYSEVEVWYHRPAPLPAADPETQPKETSI